MKQIIILLTVFTFSASTCNAQIGHGFTRATRYATETVNKYRKTIAVGISVGTVSMILQRDRQKYAPGVRLPHPYIPPKGILSPAAVAKKPSVKVIRPCSAALSLDSMNLYTHHVMVPPTDTTHVQIQDSITIK